MIGATIKSIDHDPASCPVCTKKTPPMDVMRCKMCHALWDRTVNRCTECGLNGDEVRNGWKPGMGMRSRCYSCGHDTTREFAYQSVIQTPVTHRTAVVYFCSGCW